MYGYHQRPLADLPVDARPVVLRVRTTLPPAELPAGNAHGAR
ncbi:hypothetical protein OHQ87_13280 [Micromonospora sp. NBC_00421]